MEENLVLLLTKRAFKMNYKNIFITGASRGIGAALARHYASSGVTLGLAAKERVNDLSAVAEYCRNAGALVFEYQANVSDELRMSKCVKDFTDRVSTVDLVIANAGIALTEDDSFSDSKIARENMDVNYLGLIHTLLPFVQKMKDSRSGHLVAVSSIASFRSTQNSGAYSASKSAVNLWTEGLRLRLRPFSVSVTTLHVGFVNTEMTQKNPFWMPGIISPSSAAKTIAFAIHRRKRSSLFPWQVALIWTMFRIIPGEVYDFLITWAKRNQLKKIF